MYSNEHQNPFTHSDQRVPAAWAQAHWSIQGSVGMIY